jgi:hypothetical protein
MWLSKSKKHFVGITWVDGEKKGGFVTQCDKNDYRGILLGLEGVTRKKAVDSDARSRTSVYSRLLSRRHSHSPAGIASALLGTYPFLAFAHLAFCAATIRALPSALIFLCGLAAVVAFEPVGRPYFNGAVRPFSRSLARSRRAISVRRYSG